MFSINVAEKKGSDTFITVVVDLLADMISKPALNTVVDMAAANSTAEVKAARSSAWLTATAAVD